MIKTILGFVIEPHWQYNKKLVMVPKDNNPWIKTDNETSVSNITRSINRVIQRIAPFVKNCPYDMYYGRATCFITIQPLSDELKDKVMKKINVSQWNVVIVRHGYIGKVIPDRLELAVYTPCFYGRESIRPLSRREIQRYCIDNDINPIEEQKYITEAIKTEYSEYF